MALSGVPAGYVDTVGIPSAGPRQAGVRVCTRERVCMRV